MASIIQDDLIGSVIPDVYISRITLQSNGSESESDSLLVTVDLMLKEKLDNDLIGTWFSNNEITKYLNLHVYQSTDPLLTSFLSLGSDAVDVIDSSVGVHEGTVLSMLAKAIFQTQESNQKNSNGFPQRRVLTAAEKMNELIEKNSDSRILSVKTDVTGDDSRISQFKATVDDNGNTVYNITYQTKFEIPQYNVDHLAYFAVSRFDFQQLADDFNINAGSMKMRGKVTSEIVIDDSKTVSTTFYYCDSQRRIWTGEVHKGTDGNWYSRRRGDPSSIRLQRKSAVNAKIQDFRIRKNLERLTIDFSQIQNSDILRNPTKRLTNDVIESKRKEVYFSEMYVSRNNLGQSKFLFSVDFKKAYMDNAFFGGLIKNNEILSNELVSRAQIESLNVYRRRVKEDLSQNLSGTPLGISVFDIDEPWELVVSSKEKQGRFASVNNENGSLREISVGNLERGVRHFTGMDKGISDKTDGLYQYVVEIEIDDIGAATDFMMSKIADLQKAKEQLEIYLNEGSKQSVSKFLAEVQDPHIDSPSEFIGTKGRSSGNYDSASNRFTQNFIKKMESRYELESAPWIVAPSTYFSILGMFASPSSEIKSAIFSYVNPRTGNPSGINALIGLIENLISVMSKTAGSSKKISTRSFGEGSSQLPSNRNSSKGSKKTFKITKAFDNIFDTEITKGVGIDYLSSNVSVDNTDGLRVLDGNSYAKRAVMETERFFNQSVTDTSINNQGNSIVEDSTQTTSFTYFSPARVDFPQESIILLPDANVSNTSNTRSIYDGSVSRGQSFFELQSALIYRSCTDNPAGILNPTDDSGKKNEKTKQSKRNAFNSYKHLASLLSVTVEPLRTQTQKNVNGSVTINPAAATTGTPSVERFSAQQTPDRLVEPASSLVTVHDQNQEIQPISFLMHEIIKPSLTKGGLRRRKRWMKKPNFSYDNGVGSEEGESLSSVRELLSVNFTFSQDETSKTIQGLRRTITEQEFKNFPNQIKSVFMQRYNSGAVREPLASDSRNATQYRFSQAEEMFKYEMINQVEFLSGYEKDSQGKNIIKQPIWSNLTQEVYNTLTSNQILCRMKPYQNSSLGIKRNKGIDVSVYDEYFVLSVQNSIAIRDLAEERAAREAAAIAAREAAAEAERLAKEADIAKAEAEKAKQEEEAAIAIAEEEEAARLKAAEAEMAAKEAAAREAAAKEAAEKAKLEAEAREATRQFFTEQSTEKEGTVQQSFQSVQKEAVENYKSNQQIEPELLESNTIPPEGVEDTLKMEANKAGLTLGNLGNSAPSTGGLGGGGNLNNNFGNFGGSGQYGF